MDGLSGVANNPGPAFLAEFALVDGLGSRRRRR